MRAKLYTSHDELEGVQFRNQREIESIDEMPLLVRELADVYYEEYAGEGESVVVAGSDTVGPPS